MPIADWAGAETVREVRHLARLAGHDLSRFKDGATTAIASCRNWGCHWMVEIRGRRNWRFIWLGGVEPLAPVCPALPAGPSRVVALRWAEDRCPAHLVKPAGTCKGCAYDRGDW